MLKSYLSITKPGIIFGNLISVAAGFFLAAKSEPASLTLFLTTLAGVGLVIASGCVVNNIFDRDIDQKMARTQNRETVKGNINIDVAFVYALAMLLVGTALLFQLVNPLSAVVVLLGYVYYVFFYTMWYKRNSVYGTLVGSISGAVPPLVGYLAVTNFISWKQFYCLPCSAYGKCHTPTRLRCSVCKTIEKRGFRFYPLKRYS